MISHIKFAVMVEMTQFVALAPFVKPSAGHKTPENQIKRCGKHPDGLLERAVGIDNPGLHGPHIPIAVHILRKLL